jgi:hypothetical protein
MRIKHYMLLAVLGVGTLGVEAQTASVAMDHHEYLPGERISVLFGGGPGNTKDWIGIYPEGVVPGSQSSTLWRYVDNTGSGTLGLTEGAVSFANGLNFPGFWTAFLLENDGYTVLAESTFQVVDEFSPLIRRDKSEYAPGEAITLTFSNGAGNAKDWIGVYPEGVVPGSVNSTIWRYLDGTGTGSTVVTDGSVTFPSGLSATGRYTAYLLLNDGYTVLAQEPIRVVAPANSAPRLASSDPAMGSTNGYPTARLTATILPGTGEVPASGIQLSFDGTPVVPTVVVQSDRTLVSYVGNTLLPVGSAHSFRLIAVNSVGLGVTNEIAYTVGGYTNLVLPTPIYLETFDAVPEGSLPAGWVGTTYSAVSNEEIDFGNLDSAAYAGWTTVETDRFLGTFMTYSDPESPASWGADYQRVLRVGPRLVLNHAPVTRLATGRMLFGNSGYRNGGTQVMWVETPDYDLTGRTDVHLAFHSLWEQNQDSIAAVEYSVDGGMNWMPVMILLHTADILRTAEGEVDVDATLYTERGDIARYFDELGTEVGGFYGAFLKSPISAALAPYIEGRVDDDAVGSKRIEVRRLPAADGQAKVRFRLLHAGTDSWYYGVDNFGLYSIPSVPTEAPVLGAALEGGSLRLSWGAEAAGFVLESRNAVGSGDWLPVPGVGGTSALVPTTGDQQWFRLRRP